MGDGLTVTVAQLEQQITWLRAEGCAFVSLADVMRSTDGGAPLPVRPVLVTFDDAYVDTLELALPVLRRFEVRAVVFVPTAFVGQESSWDRDARPLMNAEQLRAVVAEGWEVALHSHRHRNFADLDVAQIADDVGDNFAAFRALGLEPVPALAYPFGGRPRGEPTRAAMRATLRNAGVRLAFRIGNRVNPLPLRDGFDVNRIGPRGDESFGAFQRKLLWGRLH